MLDVVPFDLGDILSRIEYMLNETLLFKSDAILNTTSNRRSILSHFSIPKLQKDQMYKTKPREELLPSWSDLGSIMRSNAQWLSS